MLEASPTLAVKYLILSLSLLILTSCSRAIAPEVPEVLESVDDLDLISVEIQGNHLVIFSVDADH